MSSVFSVSYSQGDVCRGLTPSRSDEHSRWETGASTSGSGPCTCSENGSSIQDGIGEWLLESRWSWHPHAQQTPHHVQRCYASHCNLEHKKCNCSGGGRVGGTPAPHPSSRLTADNWIRNSPVHVCSRAGAPNLWTTGQDLLSDEQQHWIRSKVRNKCNAFEPSPNHPPYSWFLEKRSSMKLVPVP